MQYGFRDAIAKVGMVKFVSDLFWIGMFYHLYNQVIHKSYIFNIRKPNKTLIFIRVFNDYVNLKVATNTLERVAPLTHAVGNVLKRVFVIGFSIIVFGNSILQTLKVDVKNIECSFFWYFYEHKPWQAIGFRHKPELGLQSPLLVLQCTPWLKLTLKNKKRYKSVKFIYKYYVKHD